VPYQEIAIEQNDRGSQVVEYLRGVELRRRAGRAGWRKRGFRAVSGRGWRFA
jgi:hypothetical protein